MDMLLTDDGFEFVGGDYMKYTVPISAITNGFEWLGREFNLNSDNFLSKGSLTYVYDLEDKVAKVLKDDKATYKSEFEMSNFLLQHNINSVPKIFVYDKDEEVMIVEKAKGLTVDELILMGDNEVVSMDFIFKVVDKIIEITKLGINPKDLHEENIMFCPKTKEITFIDLDQFEPINPDLLYIEEPKFMYSIFYAINPLGNINDYNKMGDEVYLYAESKGMNGFFV